MEYCGRRHEKGELATRIGVRIKGKPVRLGKLPGVEVRWREFKRQEGGSGPGVRPGEGLPGGWDYRGPCHLQRTGQGAELEGGQAGL